VKQEENRVILDKEHNGCFICTEPMFNGEHYVILDTCNCVTHFACIGNYIGAELEKGNLEIKCLNSALPTSSQDCKKPLSSEDLLQVMTS
jgi:hypothetical protein